MPDEKRGARGWLSAGLKGHFSLWTHSLRTVLMTVFILLMTFMLVKSSESNVMTHQWDVHMGETLFSYLNSGFNIIMTSAAFLVMMSELPKRVSYQNYALLRISRRKWLVSLVIFCAGVVLVFMLLMLAASALLSLSFVTPGGGWSDMERLAKDPEYVHGIQYVSAYIRDLPPFAACLLAFVILFFFWTTMAFLILLFSLCGLANFGIVFCMSLLLANVTILFESIGPMKFPMHFATLGAVAAQVQERKLRYVFLVMAGYVALDALLIGLMDVRVHRMDIQFTGKE